MLVIKITAPFQDEKSLKAKSAVKAFLSQQSYNDLVGLQDRLSLREQKTGVTCYSSHVIDWAVMNANAKKDFEQLADFANGYSDTNLNILSNIMHFAQKASTASAIMVAEQQIDAEKIKRQENNPAYRLLKRFLNR